MEDDDRGLQYFSTTEEENHFYAVLSDFCDLLDEYSPQFVMMKMYELMSDKDITVHTVN